MKNLSNAILRLAEIGRSKRLAQEKQKNADASKSFSGSIDAPAVPQPTPAHGKTKVLEPQEVVF